MLKKDVVCGMQVESGKNQIEYLGNFYSFCSNQCRERFLANPHLYVGIPGQKAPKQEGASVIKQRKFRLAESLSLEQEKTLSEALLAMMGIQEVSIESNCIVVVYDLLQATAEQIEGRLSEIGVQLGEGWSERLRRAFLHYEEECEVGSLEVRDDGYAHWRDV